MEVHLSHEDPDDRIPDSEALLASTLALMTAHAHAGGSPSDRGGRLAEKIAASLSMLSEHPGLSPHFRIALFALMGHWEDLVGHRPREPHREWPFTHAAWRAPMQ